MTLFSRREFMKSSAAAGAGLLVSDLVANLVAQSPKGRPLESRFKGLADVALAEARRLGCTYADIRFSRNINDQIAVRDRIVTDGFGFGGGGGRQESAGFGVRVIHSGVWGFASSPIVTADEIRRVTAAAANVARASAIARREDVKLTPVQAYTDYWAVPIKRDPFAVPLDEKIAFLLKVNEAALAHKAITRVQSSIQFDYEWKYLATSEGSYIEQEIWRTAPDLTVFARGKTFKSRNFAIPPRTAGYEVVEESGMLEAVDRICAEAIEHASAPPVSPGLKDLVLTPSHAMLTIHEIVAHPTELDRVLGHEANYAGTSFISVSDVGKLKYGSKLFNVTGDRTIPGGMCTVGYDDDGVKTSSFPIVREGILVGLQTNRETAHLAGENSSKGCTFATSWRNYPFLRMPNVHVEAGPKGSPTPDEIIADTKDGILIDGTGSYSIDQQRYNGQFGGDAFWEIKNGKITRMVSDVTYNAITTDFWANLDAVSGPEHWALYGTTGDAKGQPVQINHPSHGSPYLRVRRIMVGAAYK